MPIRATLAARGALVVLGFTLMALARPAAAQEAPERDPLATLSRDQQEALVELLQRAQAAEDEQRWQDALDSYRQAESIIALDPYRYRQAYCLEQLGQPVRALLLYRELAGSQNEAVARNSRTRLTTLEALSEHLPTPVDLEVVPDDSVIVVDGVEMGQATAGRLELQLEPGSHPLEVRREGYLTHAETIAVEPVTINTLHVELALDTGEPPAQGGPLVRLPMAAWVVGASGAASLIAGTILGLLANDRARQERSYDLQAEGATRAVPNRLADQANTFATAANVSFAVGGGLLLTAVIIALVVEPDVEGAAPAGSESTVSPAPAPAGTFGGGVEVRF